MWKLDQKEGWELKKWCFQIVVLEKTLESPLDCKDIKPINLKGNKTWIFNGRTDAEAEAQYFGHLMGRANLLGKKPNAGKDRRQKKGAEEDEMLRLKGYGF